MASFATLALPATPALATPRPATPAATPTGDTYTWTGAGSATNTYWSNAQNWTCSGTGCVSGSTPITDSPSNVVFPAGPSGHSYTPTVDQAAEVNSLTMDSYEYGIEGSAPLTVDGATHLDGSIFTQASQTYDGPVTVEGNDVTDMVAATSGAVTFNSTVDGSVPGGADLYLPTEAVFNAPVGAAVPLGQLSDSGSDYAKTINTSVIDVTQVIFLSGETTLGHDTTISAPQVQLGSMDGGFSLTVDGSPDFTGNVGGTTPLTQVVATGAASVRGNVTTAGSQTYEQGLGTDGAPTTLTGSSVSVDSHFESEGGPVTVDAPLTIANGGSGFIDLTVDGDLNLTAGTLEMTGNLDVTGNLNAAGGSLNFDGNGAQQLQSSTGDLESLNITGGSALDVSGDSLTTGLLTGGGGLTDGGSAAAITVSPSGSDSFGGAVAGPISLAMDGTGSLNLSGNLGYSGTTSVASGALNFLSDPVSANGIADDGQVGFDLPADSTYSGIISGSGGVSQTGPGTLTLNAANTYSGATKITSGLIRFFNSGNLGTGPVILDGGGLQWGSGNSADISDRLEPIGASGATIDPGGNSIEFDTPLTGSGSLSVVGSGALGLEGNNTYSGATNVESGHFAVVGGATLTGPLNVDSGASAYVSGTADGPVTVDHGDFACYDGTLNGGPVSNDGGSLSGAPGAPAEVVAAGGTRQATVRFTPGTANCYPVSYTATAQPGGRTATGLGSPITVSGLGDNSSYTFTVTETNPMGSTMSASSPSALTGPGDPTATIASPGNGSQFTLNQVVPTTFSCSDASGGPGIASCMDSHGVSGGTGTLNTSTLGLHVYTVTARSTDGELGATSISYTVVSPPPPSSPSNDFTWKPSGKRLVNSCGIAGLKLTLPGPGTVQLLETAAPHAWVFGRAQSTAAKAGTFQLRVKPNRRGARLIKRHIRLKLTLKVSFRPKGGSTRTKVIKGVRVRGECPAPSSGT
ncbi:MAG TPA: autotransporter-associated beta strand repeat-containing protein [Solirubrobacteraceae bacterium]|jgi:autotransporter-associated beta strand protein|nr:autotransporter-associated beta strand repeat-containing protein [Solirubrobacteraceae bacterium]